MFEFIRHALIRWIWCFLLAGALLYGLLWWVSLPADALESPPSFSFVIVADVRYFGGPPYDSADYFQGAINAIDLLGAGAFMVSPGDVDPPREVYRTITRTLGVTYTWYPVVGNHELPGAGTESGYGANLRWLQGYDYGPVNPGPSGCPTTTYSFDYQNAHLVMLNEYCDSAGPDVTDGDVSDHLYAWLENDLRSTDKAHIFVFGHEPAYPQPDADNGRARHMADSLNAHPARRDRFWALLRREGVTAYFNGHTHNYSALYVDGVWQMDVGHARGRGDTGAPSTFVVVHVEGDRVTYEARRDVHDGVYDYDDVVHQGTMAPLWDLSFQDGVEPAPGYAGGRDAYVEADFAHTNYGLATPLIVDGSPDRAAFLRWDITYVPTGSQVLRAALILHVTNSTVDTYELYEVRRDWLEAGVTWNERYAGTPWQSPGAQGSDDRGADVLGAIAAYSAGTYVIDLNAAGRALVQRWIDDPPSNHGLMVSNTERPDSVQFASREDPVPGDRPRLALLVVPSRLEPEVTIAGAPTGTVGIGYAFTAYVRPVGSSVEASLPITYEWRATDQDPVVRAPQGAIDTQVYTWTLEGRKMVWLTVTHAGGTLTATHTITISRERPRVTIAAAPTGTVGVGHAFTAYVRPVEASLPITYEWRATDQAPVARAHRGVTDTQVYTWTSAGVKTIALTVTHAGSMVTGTHAITIVRLVRADFYALPRWGVRPLTVAFTNTSTCSYTVSLWDFGDGSTLLTTGGVTSTLPAPTHTYTSGGAYTVTLTVSPVVSASSRCPCGRTNGGTTEVCTTTKARYIIAHYENLVYVPVVLYNDE